MKNTFSNIEDNYHSFARNFLEKNLDTTIEIKKSEILFFRYYTVYEFYFPWTKPDFYRSKFWYNQELIEVKIIVFFLSYGQKNIRSQLKAIVRMIMDRNFK